MNTVVATTRIHEEHDDEQHPEQAARLRAIHRAIEASELGSLFRTIEAPPANEKLIRAVHDQRMVDRVRWVSQQGGTWLGPDTYTTSGTWDAALASAGAAVRVVEAVASGEARNGFALIRPPGHHATPSQSMGFCMFNNIAVAAHHAVCNLGKHRVAIVDYDVHHGNGTQDIFYEDGQVLFVSSHAFGAAYYPGTGAVQDVGIEAGYGTNLNVPLPFGAGDYAIRHAYEQVVFPALRHFQPDMILVSAGYDAHWADPLGPLNMSVSGYSWLAQHLIHEAETVCDGRIAFILEGGYNLDVIAASVVETLRALVGEEPGPDLLGPAEDPEPDISVLIERIKHTHPALR